MGAPSSPRSIRRYGATNFARADRTEDQHDAYSIAGWLSRADRDGSLAAFLKPGLTPLERAAWWRSRDQSGSGVTPADAEKVLRD